MSSLKILVFLEFCETGILQAWGTKAQWNPMVELIPMSLCQVNTANLSKQRIGNARKITQFFVFPESLRSRDYSDLGLNTWNPKPDQNKILVFLEFCETGILQAWGTKAQWNPMVELIPMSLCQVTTANFSKWRIGNARQICPIFVFPDALRVRD